MPIQPVQSKDEQVAEMSLHQAGERGTISSKVGIVIVSHNASTAVRITLASLRQAKNDTGTKVVLVDNASDEVERKKIHSSLERHVQETSLPWAYIQQDKNLGFSGGNNVGIKYFLDDPEISHICLLNSDVIVTDHWVDWLLNSGCAIVSGVTNKADSEQWIPVDYNVSMDECLDERTESIPAIALSRISDFACDWHEAWKGNLVEGEATFFCVLIVKSVFQDLGLLDETFFPGGYDDEDFCLRARRQGYKVQLARDVYVHHWGSSSFGQLQREYFYDNAQRNRKYLEDKHGIVRRRRPEKPFVSYMVDIKFAVEQRGDRIRQRRFNALYTAELGHILEDYEAEFKNLLQLVANSGREVTLPLQNQIEQARGSGSLADVWGRIVAGIGGIFAGKVQSQIWVDDLFRQFERLTEDVWTRVECNFAMYAFLFPLQDSRWNATSHRIGQSSASLPSRIQDRLSRLFWILKRGIPFFLNLRGIVFFGGYPYPERQSDGYFQRVQMVDRLFTDRWRIYIEGGKLPGRGHWFDHPEAKVLVLRVLSGGRCRNALAQALAFMLVLRCRRIYFHSIYRMIPNGVGRLMYIPGLIKVIDVHGAVPEELRMSGDYYNAVLYERMEQFAVSHSNVVVVVSKMMADYLRQKYRENLRGRIVLFPMFPNYPSIVVPHTHANEKPVIVYAGGFQKWQQVPKMITAMTRTASLYEYRFYCSNPAIVRAILPEQIRSKVIVDHKTRDELLDLYPECHYGFILREDNIVNRVASPTKLSEYLAMGIVPIVDTENIGDFKKLGMQFVKLENLLQNSLPNETQRAEMARVNLTVYERLREIYKQGANDIRILLSDGSQLSNMGTRRLAWIKYFLPPNTHRGQMARLFWASLRNRISSDKTSNSVQIQNGFKENIDLIAASLPECDIVVQVNDFEAGGLENIVLDLNDVLISAGHKVVMVVLGHAGIGVERARERGMAVFSVSSESYRELIERIKPKLILAHYSTYGAEFFHERNIPFVQVIQNAYMWFDDTQRAEFGRAANVTTAFIALSEYAKRYSVERLGIDENRCTVLPCGIDGESFETLDGLDARYQLRSRHGIGEQDFVFLSVGAINQQKNHIAAVRAFASVAAKLPLAKLVILGPAYDKHLLGEINDFIKRRNLNSRIIYAGSAPSAEEYYALADAFVSASFFEGGPLNLLEALKANLPIITTDVGLAAHFKNMRGIQIIEPPVSIGEFQGTISQLQSTPLFEDHLADSMANVYENPKRPNLPPSLLSAFDKSNAYKLYVGLIEELLKGGDFHPQKFSSSWLEELRESL